MGLSQKTGASETCVRLEVVTGKVVATRNRLILNNHFVSIVLKLQESIDAHTENMWAVDHLANHVTVRLLVSHSLYRYVYLSRPRNENSLYAMLYISIYIYIA